MMIQCFYYDGFMNDKKEDAFAALSFLEVVQGHFFAEIYPTLFPNRDLSAAIFYHVFLDGAGCYVGVENLLTRLAFSSRINVFMKSMYIPEAYYNKTPLDGHFAVAGTYSHTSHDTKLAHTTPHSLTYSLTR